MNPADLEQLVARSLRELPPPTAPRTLRPRVMAAVQRWAQRPWYSREWLTWPIGWRIASACAVAVLVAGGAFATPYAGADAIGVVGAGLTAVLDALARGTVADPATVTRLVDDAAAQTSATTGAAWVVWRVVLVPFVAYAAAIVTLMCVACAVLATALNHLAFGKALPR